METENERIRICDSKFRDDILFNTDEEGVKRIQVSLDMLRKMDLQGVDWKNVDVRGVDFRGTNADINPRIVYDRSLEFTNLEGMDLSSYSFRGVKLNNTNLCNTGAHLHSGEYKLDYELIRGCYLNGRMVPYFEDARYVRLKKDYKGKRLKK